MQVPFIDLTRQHKPIREELIAAFERVFERNNYILGDEVKEFENEMALYNGTAFAIGVSNCTNALLLSLKVLGVEPGDEVITTPFSFIATAEVIGILGARPVFCDIDPRTFNIDVDEIAAKISSATKVILPVHLYGQPVRIDTIVEMARQNGCTVVEDMAQALGASYGGRKVGSFGDTACISFFPTKNLNALGDAGMILTSSEELDRMLRAMRVHGASRKYHHDFLGYNDRLDAIQAAFLRVKLQYYDRWNEKRREIARIYDRELGAHVRIPFIQEGCETVYHQYTIRAPKRDELRRYLTDKGIGTAIHYPVPLHLQPAFAYLGHARGDFPEAERAAGEVLSLPIHPDLTDGEIEYVVDTVKRFYTGT